MGRREDQTEEEGEGEEGEEGEGEEGEGEEEGEEEGEREPYSSCQQVCDIGVACDYIDV